MFGLTQEQNMLKNMLERYFTTAQADPWADLAKLGVIGALFKEDCGGYGGTGADIALVFEEVGRACSNAPLLDCALLPGRLLTAAGRDISDLLCGEKVFAVAHLEVAARYDLAWVETVVDDGKITGEKSVVMGADKADQLIVSARASGTSGDAGGIGLYLVARDASGLQIDQYEVAQGGRAAEISFASVTAEPLIHNALPALQDAWAAGLLAQSADTLGAMDYVSKITTEYLQTRKQFGQVIGRFQVLAHRLADMMLSLEQARSGVMMAAAHLDHDPAERDFHGSACKNLMGRLGRMVAEDAIQLHGGIGMAEEYDLGTFARRIIMADHRFGDTDHHLATFIALSQSIADDRGVAA